MNHEINKDTILCISLAGRPGNFGTRFHNFLFRELDLNFIYKAFTTNDLEGAIQGVRALGIRGCAISMPFKEAVIPYLDALDPTANGIGAVNTIVNDEGRLTGHNTDYIAIRELLEQHHLPKNTSVLLQGSGGMAKAITCALRELNLDRCTIVSRNPETGSALAKQFGFTSQQEIPAGAFDLLINATPIGMAPHEDAISFPEDLIKKAHYVMDAVANPLETKLIQVSKALNKETISGFVITTIQAREQFRLYTGVTPPLDLVERAAQFARGKSSG